MIKEINLITTEKNLKECFDKRFKKEFLKRGHSQEEWKDFSKHSHQLILSACRLNAYMNFRAKLEFPDKEQPHEFDEPWYLQGLLQGCHTFFGINCCSCHGAIIEDTQNPKAYKEFCELEKTDPEKTGRVRAIEERGNWTLH